MTVPAGWIIGACSRDYLGGCSEAEQTISWFFGHAVIPEHITSGCFLTSGFCVFALERALSGSRRLQFKHVIAESARENVLAAARWEISGWGTRTGVFLIPLTLTQMATLELASIDVTGPGGKIPDEVLRALAASAP